MWCDFKKAGARSAPERNGVSGPWDRGILEVCFCTCKNMLMYKWNVRRGGPMGYGLWGSGVPDCDLWVMGYGVFGPVGNWTPPSMSDLTNHPAAGPVREEPRRPFSILISSDIIFQLPGFENDVFTVLHFPSILKGYGFQPLLFKKII